MALMLLAAPAAAAPNEGKFRSQMIKRFAATYPDRNFAPGKEPLEISVDAGEKNEATINLHRIFYYCQNVSAAECEAAGEELVLAVGAAAPEPTAASLRIIVRDREYVAYLEEQERSSSDRKRLAVSRQIGEDLFALLANDGPSTVGVVGDEALGDLKLTEAAAWDLAYRQTRA